MPVAASLFTVYGLPQGIVVAPLPTGGMGDRWPLHVSRGHRQKIEARTDAELPETGIPAQAGQRQLLRVVPV